MKKFLRPAAALLIFSVILYLFYKSVLAFVLLIPAMIVFMKTDKKAALRKRQDTLSSQFRDALLSFSAALRAGFSAENSFREALAEMKGMYGEGSPICKELSLLLGELRLGISAADAIDNMAQRCCAEDIRTFASVFRIAKQSGGDIAGVIKKTADDICAKAETKSEIDVIISSKKLEQNIMFLMPPAIILYIDLTSPSLLEPLYGNLKGAAIMTVCLVIYAAAYLIADRITTIEV